MPPMLWAVLDACPIMTDWTTRENQPSLAGAMDRCLLLVGFFGAFRRSKLVRLRIEDLHTDTRGLVAELPWSKTNQYGTHADLVALPRLTNPNRCPVRAIERWCDLAQITSGPLLRSVNKGNKPGTSLTDNAVNLLVTQAIRRAGLVTTDVPTATDPPEAEDSRDGEQPPAGRRPVPYSAHSLRAGFVTYAHSRGATASQIAHQTRHTSLASFQTYTRLASVWDDNAVTTLGL